MAITTLSGVVANERPVSNLVKASVSHPSFGSPIRGSTNWYAAGTPPASTANSAGVNGEAVTTGLATVGSRLQRTDPISGNSYISRFDFLSQAGNTGNGFDGAVMMVDRLWQNSGLSATLTTLQSITPATMAARDLNGSSNGEGVMCAIEWSSGAGAGTPAVTLTYTNQAGTTGQTTSITVQGSVSTGAWEIFPLAAGDTGIRAITGYQANATRTSGTFHLVLFRVVTMIVGRGGRVFGDALQLAMPRVLDGSVLQMVGMNGTAAGFALAGQYFEAQG